MLVTATLVAGYWAPNITLQSGSNIKSRAWAGVFEGVFVVNVKDGDSVAHLRLEFVQFLSTIAVPPFSFCHSLRLGFSARELQLPYEVSQATFGEVNE